MDEERLEEPLVDFSLGLPFGYVITARARPSTVKRTVVRLLPWALYAALPQGRAARLAFLVANRFSPMLKQRVR